MSRLGGFREMLYEQFARALQTLFRERHRLGFSHWIADHAFLVQAIHRAPVVSLPGAVAVVERQKEQREHHLVHFIFVIFHAPIVQFCLATRKIRHINRLIQSLRPTPKAFAAANRWPFRCLDFR